MRNSGSGKRMVLAAALLAALALALPVSAQAGKGGDHLFGASGTGAGQFDEPADIAVNYATVADGAVDPFGSSVDGYRYVTDVENHRIQVFGPDDSFRFTFGAGVNLTSGGDLCPRPGFPSDACGKGSTSETRGGALNGPTGIGVNQVTGDVYVRDTLNNRVQVFSAAGTFERAWGWDVIKAGQPNDVPGSEQQTVSLDSSFAQEKRDFILSFRSGPPGTVPIPYNASASQVQAALEAYGPIGSGNVEVTSSNLGGGSSVGGPWTIDFKGGLANVDVPQLMGRFTSEPTPTKYVEITTTVPGAGFEICDVDDGNVASDCKASPGFTTAGGGISRAFKDGTGLAIHQPTGDVFVIDPGTSFADNLMPGRIQQFEADGAFVAA
ncbi:MAG TPA: hypothetical protein VEQ41_09130, partial [Solirubrobacterales bacterium]|nr:hypothetical protein [Solirubrobacterales bacterium]